jgi:hypothetical protein
MASDCRTVLEVSMVAEIARRRVIAFSVGSWQQIARPRVSGRQAAVASAVGVVFVIVGLLVPYVVGAVIFIAGTFLIGSSLALWLLNRFGVLDSIERTAERRRSASP